MRNVCKFFCIIYKPASLRLNDFEPKLKSFLNFLKFLKQENLVFVDLNVDILKREKSTKEYENLLRSFDIQIQNSMLTKVFKIWKSCFDHIITETNIKTEKQSTTKAIILY